MGRTGTFIAIDNVLEQVEKEGVVGVARTVSKLRQQRPAMVKNVVSTHVCVCMCMHVCVGACMRGLCMYVWIVHIDVYVWVVHACVCGCVHACVGACVNACVGVYTCMHACLCVWDVEFYSCYILKVLFQYQQLYMCAHTTNSIPTGAVHLHL